MHSSFEREKRQALAQKIFASFIDSIAIFFVILMNIVFDLNILKGIVNKITQNTLFSDTF